MPLCQMGHAVLRCPTAAATANRLLAWQAACPGTQVPSSRLAGLRVRSQGGKVMGIGLACGRGPNRPT